MFKNYLINCYVLLKWRIDWGDW